MRYSAGPISFTCLLALGQERHTCSLQSSLITSCRRTHHRGSWHCPTPTLLHVRSGNASRRNFSRPASIGSTPSSTGQSIPSVTGCSRLITTWFPIHSSTQSWMRKNCLNSPRRYSPLSQRHIPSQRFSTV